jgi:hypothetical protein
MNVCVKLGHVVPGWKMCIDNKFAIRVVRDKSLEQMIYECGLRLLLILFQQLLWQTSFKESRYSV